MNVKRNRLKGKEIIVGIAGSIAAYKSAEIVSQLTQAGAKVIVVMTRAATSFVSPLTFQTLSHQPVYTDLFEIKDVFDPQHISLAQRVDLVLIAPATASIIGKIAAGIADDLLSTLIISVKLPILIAPAMNENMYKNPIVRENIARLKKHGYQFIEPEKGYLACQKIGEGRLASLNSIMNAVKSAL